MTPEERAGKVAAAPGSAEDPSVLIAAAIREAFTDERERCARIVDTELEPGEALPWRYRLQALLRPDRFARELVGGVRRSIARRIRGAAR